MDKSEIKYSIIIPVLNEEAVITRLMRQISDPMLKNRYHYEIIISDGGSTDETLKRVEPYADKVVKHVNNVYQKISIGRNAGSKVAAGDVLIFINGDVTFKDIVGFFFELESCFSNSEYVAFTCRVEVSPEEKRWSDRIFLGFYNIYFNFLNVIGIGMGRGECQVVRRKVFDLINGNNTDLAAGEDFDLFIRLRRKGKIYFSNRTVVYESPRRYRKKGHLYVMLCWLLNSITVLLFNKSASKEWEPVR